MSLRDRPEPSPSRVLPDVHAIEFEAPAAEWLEALPLGNGRLGAMVYGDPAHDRIPLNDGTLWSGSPASEHAHGCVPPEVARDSLAEARASIAAGEYGDATRAVQRLQSRYSQTYLPLADLLLDVVGPEGPTDSYHRRLDFRTATHDVVAVTAGLRTERRCYVSHPDGVLVVESTWSRPVEVTVRLDGRLEVVDSAGDAGSAHVVYRAPADAAPRHEVDLPGTVGGDPALRAAVGMAWRHDGDDAAPRPGILHATGVTRLTLVVASETTFRGPASDELGDPAAAVAAVRARVASALARGGAELHARHVADHGERYASSELVLEQPELGRPELETVQRLFHYGRYLLLAASRPGGLPATLQGLWNADPRPPWSSNYTININTQMNYWLAETTGLAECLDPLVDFVEALAHRGAETAERLYAAGGWCAHHNSDAWAFSSPVGRGRADPAWAFWPMAGVWLARHLTERVAFGGGGEAVARAWPIVRGAARFVLDLAVPQDGALGFSPSSSPENRFLSRDGVVAIARSSAIDVLLAREILDAVVGLAERAGATDDPIVEAARTARPLFAAPTIAPDGTVAEWHDPLPLVEPHHRHLSPLYGTYPGWDPSPAEAVRATLDVRGDDSTGWSLAWKIALRARLRDADRIPALLALALRRVDAATDGERGGLYPNLFAAHPPFQIDGNLGFTAVLAECLLQSHDGAIDLLPAVPSDWGAGRVRGLVARPGVTVALEWDGQRTLRRASLERRTPHPLGPVSVRVGAARLEVDLDAGPIDITYGADGPVAHGAAR
jgi:alpha-L-fucosidase 2